MIETAILLLSCPDAPGIVAQVTQLIWQNDGNILRSDQHTTDPTDGQFFIRLEFCFSPEHVSQSVLEKAFQQLAQKLKANWQLHYSSRKIRMGILVSQHDHCLFELLYQWRCKEIIAEIPFIISNHKNCEQLAKQHQIPFHHFVINKNSKSQQEQAILSFAREHTDFLVLARYMQILSADFLQQYGKDIINIHHSFLPSFIGANPYQQAYDRGVKIIGATAHYVTVNLDEGPIIEQMVERVSHSDDVVALKRKGKNLEKLTLTKAVEAHCQHRVIQCGNKTIVFK